MSQPGWRSAPGRIRFGVGLLRDFVVVLPAAAGVVGLLGLLRLERQFPAASSSPALLVPFLLPVLALALEAGALVALSAVQLRELLRSTGPLAVRARATLPLLAALGLVLAVAELIPRGTEHPGAFANDLVRTARESCEKGGTVPVPLLGLSVSCDEPRRIEGPMPGVRSIQVAMRELTFSDDLRGLDVVGLELTAARALNVHLVAGRARVVGLAPWSRSPRLSPLQRFGVLAALGAALWLTASIVWRPRAAPASESEEEGRARPKRRWQRLLAGLGLAVPGAVVAARFIALDQERAAPWAYGSAALAGLVALGALAVLARRAPRIFSSFSGF
jgi:hypothetical protein